MIISRILIAAIFLLFTAPSFGYDINDKKVENGKAQEIAVTVTNNSAISRRSETIEVGWNLLGKLKDLDQNTVIVRNAASGEELPSQVIFNGERTPQLIIFQANIEKNSEAKFFISKGRRAGYAIKTYGRKVPERFDDFAWENNKVAFRMYGEALEGQKGDAKGIDFWAKRTEDLVINKWYKSGDYHSDHGEGVDAYHVGMTLGAGNATPYTDKGLVYPVNYSNYKILDEGPIRLTFQLMYKTYMVNGKEVREIKTISLDAGSQLNKITNQFIFKEYALRIAAGVTLHRGDGVSRIDSTKNIIGYWDKSDGKVDNGMMGVGVILPFNKVSAFENDGKQIMAITSISNDEDFIYYQGGGWSKSGNFDNAAAWFDYLDRFREMIASPLKVRVK